MTPTEQDSELREKISHRFDSVCAEGHRQSCGEYQTAVDDIMQFITADRKRVALEEWEIAKEAVLKNAQVITDEEERLEALVLVDPKRYNNKIGGYMDKAFGFDLAFQPFAEARRKRIAELKAQQEEQTDDK